MGFFFFPPFDFFRSSILFELVSNQYVECPFDPVQAMLLEGYCLSTEGWKVLVGIGDTRGEWLEEVVLAGRTGAGGTEVGRS